MPLSSVEASHTLLIPFTNEWEGNDTIARYSWECAVTCLKTRHYWDLLVQPRTGVYNVHVNRLTTKTSFSLVFSRHPPGPTNFRPQWSLSTGANNMTSSSARRSNQIHDIAVMQEKTDRKVSASQCRFNDHHNRCVRAKTISDLVSGVILTAHH